MEKSVEWQFEAAMQEIFQLRYRSIPLSRWPISGTGSMSF